MLIQKFLAGIANMAAFSREVGIPTEAGLPHAFGNAFRNVASLVADIDFTFKEVGWLLVDVDVDVDPVTLRWVYKDDLLSKNKAYEKNGMSFIYFHIFWTYGIRWSVRPVEKWFVKWLWYAFSYHHES